MSPQLLFAVALCAAALILLILMRYDDAEF